MCGIAGFIGESKKPSLAHDIITKVFSRTESRGTDAAGFWGVDAAGTILYHKEPSCSSQLVQTEIWRKTADHSLNLLLLHARAASQGVGEPCFNKNNHPFTSSDRTLGLIHNGRIPEFDVLRRNFQCLSECDSELLLRIIEAGDDYPQASDSSDLASPAANRLMGIRDVFSFINHGHMAVALGERLEDGRRQLWLFRNHYRSLWVVDLREALGQVFFCSTPDIWQEAVTDHRLSKQKLIELPPDEVWFFEITPQQKHPTGVKRYQVSREGYCREWVDNGIHRGVTSRNAPCQVITILNNQEELTTTNNQELVQNNGELNLL